MPTTPKCNALTIGMDASYSMCPGAIVPGRLRCGNHLDGRSAYYIDTILLENPRTTSTYHIATVHWGPTQVNAAIATAGTGGVLPTPPPPAPKKETPLVDFVDLANILARLDMPTKDREELAHEAAEYCSEHFAQKFKPGAFFEAFQKGVTG